MPASLCTGSAKLGAKDGWSAKLVEAFEQLDVRFDFAVSRVNKSGIAAVSTSVTLPDEDEDDGEDDGRRDQPSPAWEGCPRQPRHRPLRRRRLPKVPQHLPRRPVPTRRVLLQKPSHDPVQCR